MVDQSQPRISCTVPAEGAEIMTTEQVETGWKFLRSGLESHYDQTLWKVDEWQPRLTGTIICCRNGYHHSPNPVQALYYVPGEIIARTEARGAYDREDD